MISQAQPASAVLVTGGAGFLGAVAVRRLVDAGHTVTVIDRGREPRHQRARRAVPEARWIDADLHDLDLVQTLAGFSTIVHLAGRPGVQTSWRDGFADHLRDNTMLTQRILEAAVVTKPTQVVLASSSSIYGDVPSGLVAESTPPEALSPYGVSKAAVEMLMGTYLERGVPAAALRFFTVYGRGQRPDMALHRIIDAVHSGVPFELRGSGRQARDFTHVDDVAAAICAAVVRPLPPGATVNVGSGRPVELRSLIEEVERLTGRAVPVTNVPAANGDPLRTAADISLAARLLHWRPCVRLSDGVVDQIRHHVRELDEDGSAPRVAVDSVMS